MAEFWNGECLVLSNPKRRRAQMALWSTAVVIAALAVAMIARRRLSGAPALPTIASALLLPIAAVAEIVVTPRPDQQKTAPVEMGFCEAQFEFRLTNKGPDVVSLDEVRTSCACLQAIVDRRQLAVGESATIKLDLNAPDYKSRRETCSVRTSDAQSRLITLSAMVKPDVKPPMLIGMPLRDLGTLYGDPPGIEIFFQTFESPQAGEPWIRRVSWNDGESMADATLVERKEAIDFCHCVYKTTFTARRTSANAPRFAKIELLDSMGTEAAAFDAQFKVAPRFLAIPAAIAVVADERDAAPIERRIRVVSHSEHAVRFLHASAPGGDGAVRFEADAGSSSGELSARILIDPRCVPANMEELQLDLTLANSMGESLKLRIPILLLRLSKEGRKE